MAIYHFSAKIISRSGGKSAVASAAYRSGEKLHDEELDRTFSYAKPEVAMGEIFLPQNAPTEYGDRETLWNAVEEVEKQSNAQLAREFNAALPEELTLEQSKALVREFAGSLAAEGMCVDACIHCKDGNHHAHIMCTTRQIKENGEWAAKERKAYKLDGNGERIPLLDENGEQKVDKRNRKQWVRETVEASGWNRTEKLLEWRERWAECSNRHLERAGMEQRIDHRSYEERGVDQVPTIHEGHAAREIEARGGCDMNGYIKCNYLEISIGGCGECICKKCLYSESGRCPHNGCWDDYRAVINPYDKAHPDNPIRKSWSNWNKPGEQGHWCRGGIFYPTYGCSNFVAYTGVKVKECIKGIISEFQDGYILCSLLDIMGCEECYKEFVERIDKKDY